MILFSDYDKDLNRKNNTSTVLNWQWNLSRSLADSYLKSDGTPITEADRTKTFVDMFTDRAPVWLRQLCILDLLTKETIVRCPLKLYWITVAWGKSNFATYRRNLWWVG